MAAAFGVLSCAAASATPVVMDFAGLPTSTTTLYTQNGITAVGDGTWNLWAWPDPDMAHFDLGHADFTYGGADFSLVSLDMVAIGGNGPARIEGFLNGVSTGYVDLTGSAGTYMFGPAFAVVDSVRVSVLFDYYHFTIDNFTIDAPGSVPEPATLALLATGIVGVGLRRRRRKMA